MKTIPPFHLAIPTNDLAAARSFYVDTLGCEVGREDDLWIDFNFFGHQLTVHYRPGQPVRTATNRVEEQRVPVRHFGVVLGIEEWEQMRDRLRAAKLDFLIEPHTRFPGGLGEQRTLFVVDPTGNALEFKAFADPERLFAR